MTATDALGNAGTDGSTNELTVDTTAPVVTVTGLSTVDNTPALTGTVNDPSATVDVTVNGATYAATNNGDGTWTLADNTIAPALADGTYDVSVTATDALGNAGTDGSTNELTVDTTAPVVTVTGLTTVDNTPALTGTVSDPSATVDVTVNGTTYAATNNGDGTWTLADNTIAPALADGTYDVSVTATDALGNAGTDGSTNELTVDTTAPVVTVTGLTTVDNTPALTGTVSDPSATVDVTVNGTTYAATNNGDGTWTLADNTIAPGLADGTYDVSVTATDALGNAGTDGSTNELTVDTTAPVVTVTGLTTVDNTPQLTGTVNDPGATVDVTVDGTTYAATNNGDGTWTLADNTIAPALADGTYDVSVTATDSLGNAGTDGSTNELTIDTTAPVVTVTGLTTVDNTPALTGTVSDPTATVDVAVNGATYAATNNGDGTWTLADDTIAPALADGTYDVSVTATDALGNAGTDDSVDELLVDTTAPIVTVTAINTSDSTPQLTGTVDDASATVDVTVNGTTYTATNNGDGTWTLADNAIAPALTDGTYDVSVTATDILGNVGTDASVNELTVDTMAPVVTVTGVTTADNTPALTGTVSDPAAIVQVTVNGTTYAATNNGDGTWTLADNAIAPALADGTYDVSVAATDAVGNVGNDVSVDELIVDATAPIVAVNSLTTTDQTPLLTGTVNDATATVRVTVDGTTYIATNNGDGTWTLADNTISPALAIGTYDVFVTATDGTGNIGVDASINELIIVPLNTAPVANDDSYSVDEDMSFTSVLGVDDLLFNDSDVDGDILIVNTTPVAGPSNGMLSLNANGTFTYTPDADFNGSDGFSYEISDGNGGVAQATVTITINAINDAPMTAGESYSVDEDLALSAVAGISDLLLNDFDRDGDSLSVNSTAVVGPSNGTLVLNDDGTFTYNPDANFNGADAFTYEVTDGNGAVSQAVVTIAVNPVNDAPVAQADSIAVNDGSSVAVAEAGLLANDTDVDGDALQLVAFTQPAGGMLSQDSAGNLVYTPLQGFSGVDSFEYTVADDSGAQDTVRVIVAVESTPVLDDSEPTGTDGSTDQPAPEARSAELEGQETAAEADKTIESAASAETALAALPEAEAAAAESPNDFVDLVQAQRIQDFGDATDDERDSRERRAADAPPPKFLYDALRNFQSALDVEFAELGMLNINHLDIWDALDTAKQDMGGADGAGQLGGTMLVQVGAGASLMLSAGALTWVLRGGALASALLSTVPMWQGFDPLPILMARKRRPTTSAASDDATRESKGLKESKAELLFEAVTGNSAETRRGSTAR